MPFFLKDFFIGLVIFLVPTASFLKPHNVRQLVTFDFYIIFVSLIFFLLILIFFSILLRFAILKILNKQPQYIFLITCFGFFLLFFYTPLHKLVVDLIFFKYGGASYFVLICLFLLWFTTFTVFIYSQSFALFFRRVIIIYASINFLIFFTSYIPYLNIIDNKKSYNSKQNTQHLISFQDYDLSIPNNTLNNKNIYYIIVDAMIGLELAAHNEIINENKTKDALEELGLVYINNTFSSYNTTLHTLASIMLLDYPITEENAKVKDLDVNLYPVMLYQNQTTIPLPEIINKVGSEFLWLGNANNTCVEWINQPWTCIAPQKTRILMRINRVLNSYYQNTPLKWIYYNTPVTDCLFFIPCFQDSSFMLKLFPKDYKNISVDLIGQGGMKYYMEYFQKNNLTNKSKFVFIHHMSLHAPYTVSKNCKPQNHNDEYEGYKANYQCILKVISEFTSFLAVEDPEAIIVFQADHGHIFPKEIETPNDDIWYKANIFNAIKAPENCFKKYKKPRSTINTIRFIINCAYGFDLPYLQQVHFHIFADVDRIPIAHKF